jgi:hypothetical protein
MLDDSLTDNPALPAKKKKITVTLALICPLKGKIGTV